MRMKPFWNKLLLLFLLVPLFSSPQASRQNPATMTVKGYPGRATMIRLNGKSYVDIESLARLTNGSISFQPGQITLTIGVPPANPESTPSGEPPKLSKDLLKAGVEELSVIAEWRTSVSRAIQDNQPLTEDWAEGYRRNAENKLALASATAASEADRSFILLLGNEFNNMQKLSDKYVAIRKTLTYISPDSLDNDPLNGQIQSCARGLTTMTASGQFQDVAVCH